MSYHVKILVKWGLMGQNHNIDHFHDILVKRAKD